MEKCVFRDRLVSTDFEDLVSSSPYPNVRPFAQTDLELRVSSELNG